eukprot:SAG11_NODE_670_length_7823_cov_9.340886_4_plen_1737_part_00
MLPLLGLLAAVTAAAAPRALGATQVAFGAVPGGGDGDLSAPFPRIASLWGAGLVGPGEVDTAFWRSCGFPPPAGANASSVALWARYGLLAAFIADSPLPPSLLSRWHGFLAAIKQLNPEVKFLATAPMMQMLTDFMTADDETAPTAQHWFPRSCLLRTNKGDPIVWWKGTLFIPNLARRECITILLDHALTLSPLIKAGLVDGFFYDSVSDLLEEARHLPSGAQIDVSLVCTAANCSGRPSTKAEMVSANAEWVKNQEWYFEQLRNLTGRQDLIVMANDLSSPDFFPASSSLVNGRMHEGGKLFNRVFDRATAESVPGGSASSRMNGSTAIQTLKQYLAQLRRKPLVSFATMNSVEADAQKWRTGLWQNGVTPGELKRSFRQHRRMRVGLGMALMTDAYFSRDWGTTFYGQPSWYAEYDAPLGHARGDAVEHSPEAFYRCFDGGIALANLNPHAAVTFHLPPSLAESGTAAYRRLKDSTDASAAAIEIEVDDSSEYFAVGGGDGGLTQSQANCSIVAGQWHIITDDGASHEYLSSYRRLNRGRWAGPLDWTATWAFTIEVQDEYTISASIPMSLSTVATNVARYVACPLVIAGGSVSLSNYTCGKDAPIVAAAAISQQSGDGGWVLLFATNFMPGQYAVQLQSFDQGYGVVLADAVRIESKKRLNDGAAVSGDVTVGPMDALILVNAGSKTDDESNVRDDDATIFYVSPSGSDEARGLSREEPVKSLEHVQLLVRAHLQAVALQHVARGVHNVGTREVTVVLMNGSWFNTSLDFTEADGAGVGTERVTWKADAGAASTVFGGARVVGWIHWRDGIWRAPLPPGLADAKGRATFQTLVEGERSCWQARTPDYGSGWLSVNASSFNNTGFGWYNSTALPDRFDCVNSACSVFARSMYSSDIRPVLSVDLARRRLTMVGGPTTDKLRGAGGPTYSSPAVYISGAVEFISTPGEWAVRDSQLYYMPYEQIDPSALTITAPATKRVLSLVGNHRHNPVRGLSIVGLRLVGSDMPALFVWSCMSAGVMDGPGATKPPCSTAEVQPNTTPLASSHGLVYTENATDIEIVNCTIRGAGGPAAVWLQEASSTVRISSNVIQDIAGHGIYANGIAPNDTRFSSAADSDVNFGHQIEDNLIVNGGLRTTHASGIFFFQSGSAIITHNKIAQFPRDAIALYGNCCNNWNAPQTGTGTNGATPRYLTGSKYWGKYLSISGQQNGTLSTSMINHCRSNLLAWNDFGQCNREGIDGGVVESNGSGGNNTWEMNAIHDTEGPGNLFFADDLSSGLTIRNNLLYENSNSLAFMIKSLNQTVERNIIADNRAMDVFYLSVYHLPSYNISIAQNLIWNSTEDGATPCGPSTNFSQELSCASYYSIEACNPDLFGPGLDFSTATLAQELAFGNSGSCTNKSLTPGLPALGDGHCIPWSTALFGFTRQQLATPIVRLADFNFVDDASRLHVGAAARWDKHTTVLTNNPFKPVGPARPWHSKTSLDYQLNEGSAAANAGVGVDVTQIGPRSQPRETYPLRRGFEKVQAETYERTQGLFTTIATGLGSGANFNSYLPPVKPGPGQAMSYIAAPIALQSGSWARFDGVDFGEHQNAAVSVVARARSVSCSDEGGPYPAPHVGPCELHPAACLLGASVRLQLDGPELKRGRTLAVFNISVDSSDFRLVSGRTGDARSPRTPAALFMVFEKLGANCELGKAGGVVDWFRFVPVSSGEGQGGLGVKTDDGGSGQFARAGSGVA